MAKSRRQRHREKKFERARQAAIGSDGGHYVGDDCSPELERAVREGIDMRNAIDEASVPIAKLDDEQESRR